MWNVSRRGGREIEKVLDKTRLQALLDYAASCAWCEMCENQQTRSSVTN